MRKPLPDEKTALQIEGLSVSYGRIEALKKVSMTINEGEIVALLGANGAGKSSLLRAISGVTDKAEGRIRSYGKDITSMPAEKIVAHGIIHAPEGRQIFSDLTVEENLSVGAYSVKDRPLVKTKLAEAYDRFPILQKRSKQVAGTLSGGEQQMLAIGRALMASPRVLLLDEPSLGLAPLIVKEIFDIVKTLNAAGTTVLLVEQNAKQSLKIAHYAYVLEVGGVSVEGTGEELLKDERIIEAYLGSKA